LWYQLNQVVPEKGPLNVCTNTRTEVVIVLVVVVLITVIILAH